MIKVKGLLLAVLAVTSLLVSCKKKEDAKPPKITIVTVDVDAFSIVRGDTVNFKFKAVAGDAKIVTQPTVIYALANNESLSASTLPAKTIDNGFEVTLDQILDSVGVYTFTLSVGDVDGLADTLTVEVTVRNPDILFTKEVSQGVLWNATGWVKGAWDLDSDKMVNTFDVTHAIIQNLDVAGAHFTGRFDARNASGAIKGKSETDTININTEMSFIKLTADYSTYTKTQAESAFATGSKIGTITPTVNDVYIAQKIMTKIVDGSNETYSKDTSIYLIKITSVDATADNGENDGKITFSYKK